MAAAGTVVLARILLICDRLDPVDAFVREVVARFFNPVSPPWIGAGRSSNAGNLGHHVSRHRVAVVLDQPLLR